MGNERLVFDWLWQRIGAKVIVWEEVPATEMLRVSGPTSGTSNVLVIKISAPVIEGLYLIDYIG